MQPRIHVITLAVADLDRALAFYRDGLGFASPGVIGSEFHGDEVNAEGAIAIFTLADGLVLAVYPRSELAKDARCAIRAADERGVQHWTCGGVPGRGRRGARHRQGGGCDDAGRAA